MKKPMIRIHDSSTGEIIDREMTDEEFTIHQNLTIAEQQRLAEIEAKEAAKLAVLEKLGLTADEVAALLS